MSVHLRNGFVIGWVGLVALLAMATLVSPAVVAAEANAAASAEELISRGQIFRRQGNVSLAIESLVAATRLPLTKPQAVRAHGELGVVLTQVRQFKLAEQALNAAYEAAGDADRARIALDLGNLRAAEKRADEARRKFVEVRASAAEPAVIASAGLNLARLTPEKDRLKLLVSLRDELRQIADAGDAARLALNLGTQAAALAGGERLAYESLVAARDAAAGTGDVRLAVEVLDGLSQLYENAGRRAESLRLAEQAIVQAQSIDARDLLLGLEWRRGRILRAGGNNDEALAAYQRAVDHIEAIRQDIPVEYTDGRSSFRDTLAPIYLGLADLLLRTSEKASAREARELLRRARDAAELIKQTELQDFLGDRCSIQVAQSGESNQLPPRTAVLYPIIMDDRLELLVETRDRIERKSVGVSPAALRAASNGLSEKLRNGSEGYEPEARRLYDWLIRPVDEVLKSTEVDDLVIVPDGVLRLIPMAMLMDGDRFVIEKYAIASSPGMSMVGRAQATEPGARTLLAGLAEPGPVVDKLSSGMLQGIVNAPAADRAGSAERSRGLASKRTLRSIAPTAATGLAADATSLRQQLALPGVKGEVEDLNRAVASELLLDSSFTVGNFRTRVESGDYRIVHIASHGLFGGTADTSFIMAYDDVITIDGLQSLLRSEKLAKQPIELLTLSACQTAEGDDRAPLGISGAALKARAKSAIGTLWPVSDEAARMSMQDFYAGWSNRGQSKIKALRQAQLNMIKNPEMRHPFFWAPFIIVGSWL